MKVLKTGCRTAMRAVVLASGLMLAVLPARAEVLRLAYETWVAPGPFFIALEKGWFAEEGVEVELVNIEDVRIRASALATGEVDAITANIDEAILQLASESKLQFAFAIAESQGGDGLVVQNDIEDVSGLKGKTVAVEPDSSRQFYLNTLLRDAYMTESDVRTVAKAPGEAGLAFERGEVDAAITWQPWLTRTARMTHGRVLTDSSQQPGVLVEMVVTRREVLEARRQEFQALYRAWLRAIDWANKNPEDSAKLIAAGLQRWLRDEFVVKQMRQGLAYYDEPMNAAFFGTAAEPGPLAETVTSAIAIWSGFGRLQTTLRANDVVSWAVVTAK
jgi:NitT/TauT family transport system substrate-binding protein